MSIATIVSDVIASAEQSGQPLSAADIEATVFRDHAAEIDAEAGSLVRSKIRAIAQERLSAGTRSRQSALPGFEIPAWYSGRDEDGTVRFVPAKTATVAHLAAHIALREENLTNCRSELSDLRKIRRRCGDADMDVRLLDALAAQIQAGAA